MRHDLNSTVMRQYQQMPLSLPSHFVTSALKLASHFLYKLSNDDV